MRYCVLILGNGFDLDLGYQTRYSDFAKSEHWPDRLHTGYLEKVLNEAADKEKWFDIESILKQYICNQQYINNEDYTILMANKEKPFFENLTKALANYIKYQQETAQIRQDSVAARLLKKYINTGFVDKIYTFNYSDIQLYAKNLQVTKRFDWSYVHGCASNYTNILGVEDTCDARPGYSYMIKTFNKNFRSVNLKFDLDKATDVIFFGHSLGETDYHYFESFFKTRCNLNSTEKEKVNITFFTYNHESRIAMLEQLRQMNERRTDYLFLLNNVRIFHTGLEEDQNNINTFIQSIRPKQPAIAAKINQYPPYSW